MAKRRTLATRSLGEEPGAAADLHDVASWISGNRGRAADLMTYQVDRALTHQLTAGISAPCAGGRFYLSRILASLIGVHDGRATADIGVDTGDIQRDASMIASRGRGIWCALPAPHLLGITDRFYGDEAEWDDARAGVYRVLMRSMRDSGVAGHVLLCDRVVEAELASLARQNVFMFMPKPSRGDLARMMEHQRQVAVYPDGLADLIGLSEEFEIQRVILIDPDSGSISRALSSFDPDQVIAGGYCTGSCDTYWKDLARSATYPV